MNVVRRSIEWVVLGGVVLVSLGCPKKTPTASPAAPERQVSAVAAPAAADANLTAGDPVADPLAADLASANEHAYRMGLLGDVYFDFDRAELRDEARERLAKNAAFLGERKELLVTLEGHCDERGTEDYNLVLGLRRATVARDYLVSLGIPADRLRVIAYGEERPQCRENGEGCWQLNRRAHFLLSGRSSG